MKKVKIYTCIMGLINYLMIVSSCSKDIYNSLELSVLKQSIDILKLYYPDEDELCVSDSIYYLQWYSSPILDSKTNQTINEHIKNQQFVHESPRYSKGINRIFRNICRKSPTNKFIAKFSIPCSRGDIFLPDEMLMRCDIVPVNPNSTGNIKENTITRYLIKYDAKGVYELTKLEIGGIYDSKFTN